MKENDNMITKFKYLNEKMDLQDIKIDIENEDSDLIEKIKRELSIITYKKQKNPKSIRIKEISGYFNKNDFKNPKLKYRSSVNINLSNGDKIKAKLSVYDDENENNISLKINNELIYNLDNKKFNNELFIDKLIDKYKNFLVNTYKFKIRE